MSPLLKRGSRERFLLSSIIILFQARPTQDTSEIFLNLCKLDSVESRATAVELPLQSRWTSSEVSSTLVGSGGTIVDSKRRFFIQTTPNFRRTSTHRPDSSGTEKAVLLSLDVAS